MTKRVGRLRSRFVSGLAVLIPLFITLWVLRVLFGFTVGIVLPLLDPAVRDWPLAARVALAAVLLGLLVYGLGELATHVLGRRVLTLGEEILLRVPVVRVIYKTSKQVVSTFQSQDGSALKSVVLVEHPRPGMKAVGFVTSVLAGPDGTRWHTVFIPTSPNPTSGYLQIVPASEITTTEFTVEEAFQMIMSLGVLRPDTVGDLLPSNEAAENLGDA